MSNINKEYCDECGGVCDDVHVTVTRTPIDVLQRLNVGDVYKMLINTYNNSDLDKLTSLLVYYLADQ